MGDAARLSVVMDLDGSSFKKNVKDADNVLAASLTEAERKAQAHADKMAAINNTMAMKMKASYQSMRYAPNDTEAYSSGIYTPKAGPKVEWIRENEAEIKASLERSKANYEAFAARVNAINQSLSASAAQTRARFAASTTPGMAPIQFTTPKMAEMAAYPKYIGSAFNTMGQTSVAAIDKMNLGIGKQIRIVQTLNGFVQTGTLYVGELAESMTNSSSKMTRAIGMVVGRIGLIAAAIYLTITAVKFIGDMYRKYIGEMSVNTDKLVEKINKVFAAGFGSEQQRSYERHIDAIERTERAIDAAEKAQQRFNDRRKEGINISEMMAVSDLAESGGLTDIEKQQADASVKALAELRRVQADIDRLDEQKRNADDKAQAAFDKGGAESARLKSLRKQWNNLRDTLPGGSSEAEKTLRDKIYGEMESTEKKIYDIQQQANKTLEQRVEYMREAKDLNEQILQAGQKYMLLQTQMEQADAAIIDKEKRRIGELDQAKMKRMEDEFRKRDEFEESQHEDWQNRFVQNEGPHVFAEDSTRATGAYMGESFSRQLNIAEKGLHVQEKILQAIEKFESSNPGVTVNEDRIFY